MALTRCPKCDGEVSTLAERCPHCGGEVHNRGEEPPPTESGLQPDSTDLDPRDSAWIRMVGWGMMGAGFLLWGSWKLGYVSAPKWLLVALMCVLGWGGIALSNVGRSTDSATEKKT